MIVLRNKFTQKRPFGIVRDKWREVMKKAMYAVGVYWLMNFLALHFVKGAAEKYGYQKRSQNYLLRKAGESHTGLNARGIPRKQHFSYLLAHEDAPLVFSGHMRDQVLKNNVVKAFPTRATVILYGPNYMNARLSRSYAGKDYATDKSKYLKVQPDKIKEMTTVITAEKQTLNRVLVEEVSRGMAAVQGTRVTNAAA